MILTATGHRPDKIGGWNYTNPTARWCYTQAHVTIGSLKPVKIITGGAMGWDQIVAIAALNLSIPLEVAIPFKGFEDRWSDYFKDIHSKILKKATSVHIVCPKFYYSAYQVRNEYMVDKSTHLLALWNGTPGGTENCYKYAEQIGKPITRINPNDYSAG